MKLIAAAGRARARVALLATLAAGSAPVLQAEPSEPEEPRRTPIVERTEARLAQIDLSLSGPPDAVASLLASDLVIRINYERLDDFELDRYCGPHEVLAAAPAEGERARPAFGTTTTFLFYFDQTQLTLGGRQRGLDLARRLIAELVHTGNQALIVSNAQRMGVVEELTADPQRLLAALDRLEQDREQWDAFATEEELRVAHVAHLLNADDDVLRAVSAARSYQREEHWRTDKNVRRMAVAIARLADLPLPKAVVYFGDKLRMNPGEHYLSFFAKSYQRGELQLGAMASDAFTAGLAFDRLVNDAVAQGIRFYPVRAEGLATSGDRSHLSADAVSRVGAEPQSSRLRDQHVQTALGNLATETGGQAFLYGDSARKIAQRIGEDLGCLYVVSFDPSRFNQDAPLRLSVASRREGVRVHARGRVVLQSGPAKLASRLLGAFALNDGTDDLGLRANLVPLGFAGGAYSALLQVSVPGTTLPVATWDLGATVVLRDRVRDEIAGRMTAVEPGVRVVLEREVSLPAGAHEIVAVAHEQATDFILSDHVRGSWPDPDRLPASCGPTALLQPVHGAYVRSGDTRTWGSLARSAPDPISPELPVAFVQLICRGRRKPGPLGVERALVGERRIEFPPLEFDLDDERCVQVRDLVPPDSLLPGEYRYEVRVLRNGEPIDSSQREFVVLAPAASPTPGR